MLRATKIDGRAANSELMSHLKNLRQHPYYKHARIIVFPESNNNWQVTDTWASAIRNAVPNTEIASTDRKYFRPGVTTTKETKEAAVPELQERLDFGTIHVADHVVSRRGAESIREMYLQLGRFMRKLKERKSVFEANKYVLTGKGSGGQQDDIAMALQQLLVQAKVYMARVATLN